METGACTLFSSLLTSKEDAKSNTFVKAPSAPPPPRVVKRDVTPASPAKCGQVGTNEGGVWGVFDIECWTAMVGGTAISSHRSYIGECLDFCTASAPCVAAQFEDVNELCTLFSVIGGMVPSGDSSLYIKRPDLAPTDTPRPLPPSPDASKEKRSDIVQVDTCPTQPFSSMFGQWFANNCELAVKEGIRTSETTAPDFAACMHLCFERSVADCWAFVWYPKTGSCNLYNRVDKWEKNPDAWAFIKSEVIPKDQKSLVVSYKPNEKRQIADEIGRKCPTADILKYEDTDYKVECDKAVADGSIYRSFQTIGYGECLRTCGRHERSECTVAQWHPATNECTLFKEGGYWVDRPHSFGFVKSGFAPKKRRQETVCPGSDFIVFELIGYNVWCGKAVSGAPVYDSFKTGDYNECLTRCGRNQKAHCKNAHWNHETGECTLFRPGGQFVDSDAYVTFEKGDNAPKEKREIDSGFDVASLDSDYLSANCVYSYPEPLISQDLAYKPKCATRIHGMKVRGDHTLVVYPIDCMDECTSTPGCIAATFMQGSHGVSRCELYSSVESEFSEKGFDSFYPSTSAVLQKRQDFTCPASTGEVMTVDGASYTVKCETMLYGPKVGSIRLVNGDVECMRECSQEASCVAAHWVQGGHGGNFCSLFSSVSEESSFDSINTFVKINARLVERQISDCPATTNSVLEVDGVEYTVKCGTEYTGRPIGGFTIQPSYANCIARCSERPDCTVAQYTGSIQRCEIFSVAAAGEASEVTNAFIKSAEDSLQARQLSQKGLCPAAHNEIIQREGKSWRIKCDTYRGYGWVHSFSFRRTPEECISECASYPGCEWGFHDGRCRLMSHWSPDPTVVEGEAPGHHSFILVDPVTGEPLLINYDGSLRPDDKRRITADGAVKDTDASVDTKENALEARQWPTLEEMSSPCPATTGEIISRHGMNWRVICDREISGKMHGFMFPSNMDNCFGSCASHKECGGLVYKGGSGFCQLYYTMSSKPSLRPGYHSFILVGHQQIQRLRPKLLMLPSRGARSLPQVTSAVLSTGDTSSRPTTSSSATALWLAISSTKAQVQHSTPMLSGSVHSSVATCPSAWVGRSMRRITARCTVGTPRWCHILVGTPSWRVLPHSIWASGKCR